MTDPLLLTAAIAAKRMRDTVKEMGMLAPVVVLLRDGGDVHGRIAYWGIVAFGVRTLDGALRAIRYTDVDDLYDPLTYVEPPA